MKNKCKKIFILILVGIFLAQCNMVIAATTQSDLNDVNSQIEDKKEEIEGIQQEKSETMQEVEKLISDISEYESQIEDLDAKIEESNQKIKEQEEKLKEAEEDYSKQEELLNERLIATYEAGEVSYLDFILSSHSLTEFISNFYLVSELAQYDTEMLNQIEEQRKEIEEAKQTLENSKKELDDSKAQLQKVTTQLQASKAEKDSYAAQLTAEEKQAQEELEVFEADKKAIEKELAEIARKEEVERKKNEQNGNSSSIDNIANNPSSSGYIRPIVGYKITTPFGRYSWGGKHTGADFSGSGISGKPILAVKDGTVVTSEALKYSNGNYRSYGEYIVINHGDGTMTLYAHGAPGSRKVKVGDKVKQGQTIMNVGTTGNSTGYHLHFEVRINGVPVNPAPYLP